MSIATTPLAARWSRLLCRVVAASLHLVNCASKTVIFSSASISWKPAFRAVKKGVKAD